MLLVGKQPLDFLGFVTRKSKKTGKEFQLVQLGDSENYTRHEYFWRDELDVHGLEVGCKVIPHFKVVRNGYNENMNLVALVKV